jgi:hypothetical protein
MKLHRLVTTIISYDSDTDVVMIVMHASSINMSYDSDADIVMNSYSVACRNVQQ